MTGRSVGFACWMAAMAAIIPVPVPMVAALTGDDVCVSFVPDMNPLIWRVGRSFWNGDSGA